jgi:FtsP/CotA-like multicopper oxidase with cupredoxin domain
VGRGALALVGAGLAAGVCVLAATSTAVAQPAGHLRVYYIAADELDWDYAPSGRNLITGQSLDIPSGPAADRIGLVYRKAVYREYTDASFTHLKPRPPQDAYMGFLGPVIRAEVGDTVKVVFKNNTRFPARIVPQALVPVNPVGALAAVPPHGVRTYEWSVPERAGPGPDDPSSIAWLYFSDIVGISGASAGLTGPIVVTRRGSARADGSPADVDRELFTLFVNEDENTSPYFDDNSRRFTGRPASAQDEDPTHPFYLSNDFATINGFIFGNMPTPAVRVGQRVRWYLLSGESDQFFDYHQPYWDGNTVVAGGQRTAVGSLEPAMTQVADMIPREAGTWILECRDPLHVEGGMVARYRVLP